MDRGAQRARIAAIEWRGNPPQPFPVFREAITKENVISLKTAALSSPYIGLKDPDGSYIDEFEEEYDGRTCAEVIALRQAQKAARGDIEHIKYLEDRVLGKPTQHNQNLNYTVNWKDLVASINVVDEETPLEEPPDLEPYTIEVGKDYQIVVKEETIDEDGEDEQEEEDYVIQIPEYSDDEILSDPLVGF